MSNRTYTPPVTEEIHLRMENFLCDSQFGGDNAPGNTGNFFWDFTNPANEIYF